MAREFPCRVESAKNRPDTVQLMLEAEKGRILDLSPPRHGRIARSPCKFYFGAPRAIAYDLAFPPVTRVRVQ